MRILNRLRPSKAGQHDEGSVLLETVLVLPLLMLLLLAVFELGRAVYVQTALNAATHQGVRVAAQRGGGSIGNNAAATAFRNAVSDDPLLGDAGSILGASFSPSRCTNSNSTIRGSTRFQLRFVFGGFNALSGMLGDNVGGGITLRGRSNLRCEITW